MATHTCDWCGRGFSWAGVIGGGYLWAKLYCSRKCKWYAEGR